MHCEGSRKAGMSTSHHNGKLQDSHCATTHLLKAAETALTATEHHIDALAIVFFHRLLESGNDCTNQIDESQD